MPTRPLNEKLALEAVALVERHGNLQAAANASGIPRQTLQSRVRTAGILYKRKVNIKVGKDTRKEDVVAHLRNKGSKTLTELSKSFQVTPAKIRQLLSASIAEGHNVFLDEEAQLYSIETVPQPVPQSALHTYCSDAKGRYRFGFVTDNHLCSKYAREDVLADLYNWFAEEGITRVYNAGNWIDGEARFNVYDLKVRGMEAQCQYFAENYPARKGIETHFIAGNDHEGWYSQREGVDIGKYAERVARDSGRTDLRYLGYMEAFIKLEHRRTHASSQMLVVHPGGGSAYAISYTPQKLVESLQGGEKPAVVLIGHYHKMDWFNYRNVWICQGGTTEDQTPFMRSKRLEAHVGGTIIELRQGERGEINDAIVWMRRYFDRGYYNDRFSLSGPVNNPTVRSY